MKILYITTFYDKYGGAEVLIRETVDHFSKQHSIDIVSIMPSSEVLSPNKSYKIDVERTISFILDLVNREKYDFVHIFLGHSLMLKIAIELKKKKVKVLFHIIDAWFTFSYFKARLEPLIDKEFFCIRDQFPKSKAFKSFTALSNIESEMENVSKNIPLKKFADIVACCSKDVRNYIVKYHSGSTTNVKLVPLYKRLKDVNQQKIETSSINNIAYVGRISDSWKGFSTFLKANKNKKHKLYVFDNTPNILKYFSAFNKVLNLDHSKINIINNVVDDAKIEAMKSIGVVIIPSIAEGFSFVMIESMSLGKIVVVGAKFGGPKDVIKDGVNGFVFKSGDDRSLSKVIDQIGALNLEKLKKVSINAVKTASDYTMYRYMNNLEMIYKKI